MCCCICFYGKDFWCLTCQSDGADYLVIIIINILQTNNKPDVVYFVGQEADSMNIKNIFSPYDILETISHTSPIGKM